MVKLTIEVNFDGQTPVVTAQAHTGMESDAGRGPDGAADPALAAASPANVLADAGAPAPPPFDMPAGVLAVASQPAAAVAQAEPAAIDGGPAPQLD
jgi:hypothetical protein